MTESPQALVNSWNEWDPLEEIIVGTAEKACYEPTEPGYRPRLRNAPRSEAFPKGPKPQHAIDDANNQLDGLVALLTAWGATVRRPTPHDFSSPLRTPTFAVENQYCAVCPRDVIITIGNEVIEAPMSRRARYFEYLAYRDIIRDYWERDSGVVWTVAPKPSMGDTMYRQEFWELPMAARHRRMRDFEFCITQDEILFDAADMTRLGRDVLVQESMTTNRAGIAWLTRHLGRRGLRVWPIHFPLDVFPSHIDCTFVPLRPGLVLTNPERPIVADEAKRFVDNGWELVDAPLPISSDDQMPRYCQSSKWLSMNLLSLSPTTVVCEEKEKPLQDLLGRLGFEVLTVPFRKVYEFGGSLHCATWDVRRVGTCEDLFPRSLT